MSWDKIPPPYFSLRDPCEGDPAREKQAPLFLKTVSCALFGWILGTEGSEKCADGTFEKAIVCRMGL